MRTRSKHREALIDHGLRLIRRDGYNGTGVADILEAASAPKGSFYHHFEDKEAFGIAVLERYYEDHLLFLRKITDGDGPARDKLRSYFEKMIEGMERNEFAFGCLLGSMSLEMAVCSPAFRERLVTMFTGWGYVIADVIEEGRDAGDFCRDRRSVEELAEIVLTGWEGALITARARHDRRPLDLFIDVVFEEVLR